MQIDGMGSVAANAVRSAQASAEQTRSTAFADELKNIQSADAAKEKKLKEACQGFEEMFLNLVYSKMRETVPDWRLTAGKRAEILYRWTFASVRDAEAILRRKYPEE